MQRDAGVALVVGARNVRAGGGGEAEVDTAKTYGVRDDVVLNALVSLYWQVEVQYTQRCYPLYCLLHMGSVLPEPLSCQALHRAESRTKESTWRLHLSFYPQRCLFFFFNVACDLTLDLWRSPVSVSQSLFSSLHIVYGNHAFVADS